MYNVQVQVMFCLNREYGNLTRTQRKHNYFHSCTRTVIEHTFGLLKGRWRCMLGLILKDIGKCSDFVLACCVLHNFCYLHNDDVIQEMVRDERRIPNQVLRDYSDNASKRLGDAKRNRIADTLWSYVPLFVTFIYIWC